MDLLTRPEGPDLKIRPPPRRTVSPGIGETVRPAPDLPGIARAADGVILHSLPCTTVPGHSLQGRPIGNPSHVRCDAEAEVNSER
jgi:hypothetical protein